MRIVLFTPVGAGSAIARVSVLVHRALVDGGVFVDVVGTDADAEGPRVVGFENALHWTDETAVTAILETGADVVHQLGDSYFFHRGTIEWLPRTGGVICLHDFFLGSLFWEWSTKGHEAEAHRVLEEWYGSSLADFYALAATGSMITETWPTVTFVEWLVCQADGVITHSDSHLTPLLEGTAAPVDVVAMPYDFDVRREPRQRDRTGRTQVLTFGVINPNKCAADVIRAIGGDAELRGVLEYRLAGSIEDSERELLTALAHSQGVHLTILGPVSSVDLAHELDEADVVVCLRNPSIEAASASAIEAMLTANAVIVADTGFYSSLPRDAVLHTRPEDLIGGVRRALHRVHDEPGLAAELGQRARDYALATFRADRYADRVVAMCELASRNRPFLSAVRATTHRLGEWGMSANSELLASSRAVLDFFAPPSSPAAGLVSDG